MKAMIFNASPRKNQNTAKLLKSAMDGAAAAGFETELINLFDYEFTGCRSCFACKVRNSRTNGICAVRDSIRPLLEKTAEADVLIFGSPVYYGYPAGQLRSFVERLMFPLDPYMIDENGQRVRGLNRTVPTGLIFTMNVPEQAFEKVQYPTLLGFTGKELGRIFGYNECLYSMDTYQFTDYSRYDVNMFDPLKKAKHREIQFPIDCEKAFDLGRRLAEMAAVNNG